MSKNLRLLALLLAAAVPFLYTPRAEAAINLCAYAERQALTSPGTVTYFAWHYYWLTYCQP